MIEWITQEVTIPLGAFLLLTALPFNRVSQLLAEKLKVTKDKKKKKNEN